MRRCLGLGRTLVACVACVACAAAVACQTEPAAQGRSPSTARDRASAPHPTPASVDTPAAPTTDPRLDCVVAQPHAAAFAPVVRALCAELHALDGVSASVAIAIDGQAVFSAARGPRCWGAPTPLHTSTRMRLGSITKLVTAAVVLVVAREHDVELDQPLRTTLPELTPPPTLRTLLTHSAGLRDVAAQPLLEAGEHWLPLLQSQRRDAGAHVYANASYLVLGKWIDTVAGRPFPEVFAEHPAVSALHERLTLGVTDAATASEVGCGHRRSGAQWDPIPLATEPPLPTWTLAAGGGIASVEDLALIPSALERTGLRPALTRSTVSTGRNDGEYGFGIRVHQIDGRRVLAHAGKTETHAADLRWDPDQGIAVAVMSSTPQPFKATLHAAFAAAQQHPRPDIESP
ncbi:MAG: beta-lactamase family protein [Deltaproteobacteria bacterium]|nr:beta-lactamase family protein [Deltaproteobacteria bacterium]